MRIHKLIAVLLLMVLYALNLHAQEFGPPKVKSFDIKLLKGKVLYVPVIDKVPVKVKDMNSFNQFRNQYQIDDEWKRRVDEAMAQSSFDFLPYEVKKFGALDLKKDKDKIAVVMYFEKDFYDNLYAYIALCDPKWEIIANCPVNDLTLTNIKDLTFMFNMLQYSLVVSSAYYGDAAKSLYRGHENKYAQSIRSFGEDLSKKVFIFPKYDKKERNFEKKNEQMNEFLKLYWKLTPFEFISQVDHDKRVNEGFNGIYLHCFVIYTSNPKSDYYYYVFLTDKQDVLYWYLSKTKINAAGLNYAHARVEEWIVAYMDAKRRKEYDELKNRQQQSVPGKGTSKSGPPKPSTPPKTTPPKSSTPSKTTPSKDTKSNQPQQVPQKKK